MLTIPPTTKLWFASAVDLRLGFDGLANLVRTQLSADPLSGHLFVFTNRTADRVKVLYWAGHVITAKFADHVPVHRLAGQLARSGVQIASSTLGDWLRGASELLVPLYKLCTRSCSRV